MRELVAIDSGQLLSSGIFPGMDADVCPLWINGENVLFESGGVRKNHGLLGLADLTGTPTGLKSVTADGEARLFFGVGDKAYRYRASDGATEIGSFASSGVYQFQPWDTWCLISNGVDPVELWQNAGASAPITAPFTRANTLFGYQLQAFVGGSDVGGNIVHWSPINLVTDWTETLTNTAGKLPLRQLESDIVAAKPISGSVGIYSKSQGGLFTFVGGTNPYTFRNPIDGVGAIGPYSVVADGPRHYGILQDRIFVTDLITSAPIDEPAVRSYLEEAVDWDRQAETYGWLDRSHSLIRWALPADGGGFLTIGYRTDNGVWTKFNDGVCAGEPSGAFDDMLLAKPSRLLRNDRYSVNNDVLAQTSFIQTKPLDLGAKDNFKRVMKLALKGSWTGTINVYLGNSESPNSAVTWEAPQVLPADGFIYPDQLGIRSEFHYLSIKIESTSLGANWKLAGATIFGEVTAHVN